MSNQTRTLTGLVAVFLFNIITMQGMDPAKTSLIRKVNPTIPTLTIPTLYPNNDPLFLHDLTTTCEECANQPPHDFIPRMGRLLTDFPEAINAVNDKNQTPLNIALEMLDSKESSKEQQQVAGQLVILYKIHGGLKAEQLQQ